MPGLCLTYKPHSNLFINSLVYLFTQSLILQFTYSLFHSFILLPAPSVYLSIYLLIDSFILFIQLLITSSIHPSIYSLLSHLLILSFFADLSTFQTFSDTRGEGSWAWFLGNTDECTGSGVVLRGWTYSILWDQKILNFCSLLWSDVMTLGGKLFTILYVYSLRTVPGLDQKFFFGHRKWLCSISCWGRMGRDGSDIECSWPGINQLLKAGPFCKGASF